MIEYIMLIILIMAGIMIGGRYVYRSWNANLKGWEDSAVDSVQDPLLQDGIDFLGCENLPWEQVGCGAGPFLSCGSNISCGFREMTEIRAFEPAGCNCALSPPAPSVRCDVNDCCCEPPTTTGLCGAAATQISALSKPDCASFPPMFPKNLDGTCPAGMMEAYTMCGSDTEPRYGCVFDPACTFRCTSPPAVPSTQEYGPLCPGDDLLLEADLSNIFVNHGECTVRKCETQCAVGFYAFSGGTFCGPCRRPGVVATSCSGGTYSQGTCPAKHFESCCYEP